MGALGTSSSHREGVGLLALFIIVTCAVLLAQDSGLLRVTIVMPDTDEFYRNDTVGHRSYVELDTMTFTITMTNGSTMPVAVDQAKLREAYTVRVRTDFDIPVALRWVRYRAFDPDTPLPVSEDAAVRIQPREAGTWTVVVQRLDRLPFTWGEYTVSLTVGSLRQVVSTPNGGIWGGRLMDNGTYRRLVSVKAPTRPAETARRHAIASSQAYRRGDYETALQSMIQAAAADPSLEENVASIYLAAGRYEEAVAGFERAAARRGLHGPLTLELAQAYVGIGDEIKASQVLIKGGVPQDAVGGELDRMRKRVSDRALELQQQPR